MDPNNAHILEETENIMDLFFFFFLSGTSGILIHLASR